MTIGGGAGCRRLSAAARAGLAGAFLAGWLALAYGWVPSLLEAGYRQESFDWIDGLFPGRATNPFENYLDRWFELARLGSLWCAILCVAVPFRRRIAAGVPRFFERFVGPATPDALGAIRAWTCAILFFHVLLSCNPAAVTLLPEEMIRPMGVMSLLRGLPVGYDALLADPEALGAFRNVTALLLLLGAVGLGTRFVVPAAAVCFLVSCGIEREYSFFNHGGMVPWYVLAVLAFTPCDRGLSLDRLLRVVRGRPTPVADRPAAEFGWARYAVWTTIASVYLMAGLSKLHGSGPGWVAADNMRAHFLRPNLKLPYNDDGILFSVLQAPDLLFVLLGVLALGTQLAFGLVLVSRLARLAVPAAMIVVHAGIWLVMDILFVDLMLLPLMFYDWRPLRLAAERRLAALAVLPARRKAPLPRGEAVGAARAHRRGALVASAVAALAATVWTAQIGYYPLSSIPLFIVQPTPPGIVEYEKAIVRYEDGSSEEAPFDRWFGLGMFRFRPVAEAAFRGPEGRETARKFLDAAFLAAGRLDDGPRPARLELQLWRWNFADDPADPDRGVPVDRLVRDAPLRSGL